MQFLGVRLSVDLERRLQDAARDRGTTVSSYVRDLIEAELERSVQSDGPVDYGIVEPDQFERLRRAVLAALDGPAGSP